MGKTKYKYVYSYKRIDGIYYYFSYDGKVKRGYKTALGAYQALQKIMKLDFKEMNDITFPKLITLYRKWRYSYGSDSTHEKIDGQINLYMKPYFPFTLPIVKYKEKDFKKFYENLKFSDLEKKNRVLNRLIDIFKYFEKAYGYHCIYVYRLPKFDSDIKIDFTNLNDDDFYNQDEIMKIYKSMNENDEYSLFKKTVVISAICSCTRISELRGLTWDHYDGKRILIDSQLYRGKKKKLKSKLSYRTFNLLSFVNELFLKWKTVTRFNKTDDYIFIHPGTNNVVSPQTIRRWIEEAALSVGLPYRYPHKGRHTVATLIRQVGGDEYIMGQILGHSPDVAKKIYAHAFQEEKNKTIESIDALFNNNSLKSGT